MSPARRAALADALLGAGATLLLLYSTDAARGGRIALAAGIVLIVAGAALLWGTPKPDLRLRMMASIAGLLVGFGAATWGTPGAPYSIGGGALLFAGVLLRAR